MFKRLLLLLLAMLSITGTMLAQYTNVTDLPAVYVETFDGKSISSKTTYKYCRLYYVDESGLVTGYDSVSIRGRGNSTWNMAKKPYRLKFNDKEKFLGKGYAKAKKWTLLANAGDKTMMRNAVTSAMGAFTSLKFNPAAKFVDLVLNNVYMGTYQVSDQVDIRPHRVDIVEQNFPLGTDDDISGGYLLEVDGFRDGNCFTTSRYQAPVRIHSPDEDEIVSRQTVYIRNYVNEFEAALASSSFTDQESGYRAYVDTTSLIDWYICTEVSANIDGFFSTYFYKEQNDPRLYWGPLWDYDIAYNNDERVRSEHGLGSSVNSLMADIGYSGSKAWVNRMWQDPWFQRAVYNRYRQLMDAGLPEYMIAKVDSLNALLSQSQLQNYKKWGINRKMYHEMVLYSSYDQYVADLKTFITAHCDYLEQAFADRRPAEPTPAFVAADCYYHIVNAKTGKAIEDAGSRVQQYTDDNGREREDWQFKTVGNYFQIINRSTGWALNDPTTGDVGPTTNVGAVLNTARPDAGDLRQLWLIHPQGTAGFYNLENAYSSHIANLEGGSSADGAALLSYSNDSRNSSSQNRLWRLVPNGSLPAELTGVESAEPEEYALAYDPVAQVLHFGSATPGQLTFTARVVSLGGRTAGQFRADEAFLTGALPAGIYIVTWTAGGRTRSVKFRKE